MFHALFQPGCLRLAFGWVRPREVHATILPLKRPRGWLTRPIDPRFSLKLRKVARMKGSLATLTSSSVQRVFRGWSLVVVVHLVHCLRLAVQRAFHISTSARRKPVGFIRHSTRSRPNRVAFLCQHVLSSRATSWHHIQFLTEQCS